MPDLDDLFELADLLTSWRFYVGMAITAALCCLVFFWSPNETVAWIVTVPVFLAGVVLSWRWDQRAGQGN